ncbi:helix-turn-helix transcriptional regulator [Allomuricauda sp. M10]|uniref:helix-turn-helix transcriptional regulator n=1 Tax=Allomuricauda sp. M10 TaxID=2683292 RepID=UPI001D196FCC|nr:helix-turn-helix transcriptional regulator [Muricauda sp. M10]
MNEGLVSRIQAVIDFYGLTVSAFADKIGVQRSSISHLLSGRNKPSLDFVLKLVQTFPDVNLYWLLKGEGDFPTSNYQIESSEVKQVEPVLDSELPMKNEMPLQAVKNVGDGYNPVKIVIFYPDGTFESFHPKID